jgi:hypothetical protein
MNDGRETLKQAAGLSLVSAPPVYYPVHLEKTVINSED